VVANQPDKLTAQIADDMIVSMVIYDIQDLMKVFPAQAKPANDGINLQIHQGEIFGLLGDNGAGKSTLVRQMANLLRSTSGRITFLGQEIGRDMLHIPLHVGDMPQDVAAINNLTVDEALFFTAHLRGLSRGAANAERDHLLDLWGIGNLRHKAGPQLSGGERRLTYLAVAMAGSPPVLILDEPTNDLAPQRRNQVWDILRNLNQAQGTTIIFITHDAIEAEKIIQRVGILQDGKLVALGKPSQLKMQVDQKLRLEMFTSAPTLPALPQGVKAVRIDNGRWLAYLERNQVAAVMERLDLGQLDDFRLYSATLEDLYLHYANAAQPTTPPRPTA
jgi:ABC-2 type transport system ATP-binding protein